MPAAGATETSRHVIVRSGDGAGMAALGAGSRRAGSARDPVER